jgi:hypothetical protein
MRVVRFTDIDWDMTDEESEALVEEYGNGLPTIVSLEVDDDVELDTEGADVLSDKYGWCVNSFNYEIVPE